MGYPTEPLFTHAEAEAVMQTIDEMRQALVIQIRNVTRMTSIDDSQKNRARAPFDKRLQVLVMLRERIGTAYHLGGE